MQVCFWTNAATLQKRFSRSYQLSLFHSSPISLAKWKSKWSDSDVGEGPKSSKNYIRYAVRQKRADAKRALKNFLYYGRPMDSDFQDDDVARSRIGGKSRTHNSGKSKQCGNKRWRKKHKFYDEDEYEEPARTFQASSGKYKSYTWSFPSWHICFENATAGFEWRDESEEPKTKRTLWSESDLDEEEPSSECNTIGAHSHRVTLGLPTTGPLKLDDVKSAFRASALKWHPDKHQGSSQATAEEKFKLCVDAYNSLCSAIKAS